MKTMRTILLVMAVLLVLLPNLARSEDIDIFTGDTTGGESNMLIVLDNSTNWGGSSGTTPTADEITFCGNDKGTFFCAQKVALINLLKMRDPLDSTKFFL